MPNTHKKPDLNAPRYRPKKLNFTNVEYYNKFKEENPKYASLSLDQFKQIITMFNGKIWQTVIEERDGVELPEQLGYLFIGTCPRAVKKNVNFHKSQVYGYTLQNQNWESDDHLAKIFYTNFETKYCFKNHELWGFTAVRDFKRSVAKAYPTQWKKYLQVDDMVRVSRIFRKKNFKLHRQAEEKLMMEYYDEFNLETPWLEIE